MLLRLWIDRDRSCKQTCEDIRTSSAEDKLNAAAHNELKMLLHTGDTGLDAGGGGASVYVLWSCVKARID